jgi:putative hydrolase of the HAD superfamily
MGFFGHGRTLSVSKDPTQNSHQKESYARRRQTSAICRLGIGDQFMAVTPIRAVVFDMGGTLEDLYYDDASRQEATRGLQELLVERGLDPCLSLPDLQAAVLTGMKVYQEWREESEIELPPERVWTEYIFPNHGLPKDRPPEWDLRLMANAEDFTFFYETHFHVRSLRPEAPALLDSLHERGFCLAVISNIIAHRVVQYCLERYGIEHYFDPVITSAGFGWRKPNPRIFLEAARLMNLPPVACAYVGDTVSRDVIGAPSQVWIGHSNQIFSHRQSRQGYTCPVARCHYP